MMGWDFSQLKSLKPTEKKQRMEGRGESFLKIYITDINVYVYYIKNDFFLENKILQKTRLKWEYRDDETHIIGWVVAILKNRRFFQRIWLFGRGLGSGQSGGCKYIEIFENHGRERERERYAQNNEWPSKNLRRIENWRWAAVAAVAEAAAESSNYRPIVDGIMNFFRSSSVTVDIELKKKYAFWEMCIFFVLFRIYSSDKK